MFQTIINGLLPSFLLIIIGGLIRDYFSSDTWKGIDKLNFYLLFPTLLFVSTASRKINFQEFFDVSLAVWGILIIGLSLGWLARPLGPSQYINFAAVWQTTWRFNAAIGFVVINALPNTDSSLMALIVGAAVPIANLFAITALSYDKTTNFKDTIQKIGTNPFFLASFFGVFIGLTGFQIPTIPLNTLNALASTAVPITLISIGASLSWREVGRLQPFNSLMNMIKLILLPTIVLGACVIFLVPPQIATVLVVFAALPTSSSAHILASAFGADQKLVANLVAQSTILSCLTLPVWIVAILSF